GVGKERPRIVDVAFGVDLVAVHLTPHLDRRRSGERRDDRGGSRRLLANPHARPPGPEHVSARTWGLRSWRRRTSDVVPPDRSERVGVRAAPRSPYTRVSGLELLLHDGLGVTTVGPADEQRDV